MTENGNITGEAWRKRQMKSSSKQTSSRGFLERGALNIFKRMKLFDGDHGIGKKNLRRNEILSLGNRG